MGMAVGREVFISIHSPHTGRDSHISSSTLTFCSFQSTLPTRGETLESGSVISQSNISIHSPHTGRDIARSALTVSTLAISIHSPHTGRDSVGCPLHSRL